MQITWLGQSCFKIQAKTDIGEVTIITDPFSDEIGLKMPKVEADIATISHNHHDHSNIKSLPEQTFIINGPGEYEIKGVFIYGFSSFHDEESGAKRGKNIIYTIKLIDEGITLAHLGDLGKTLNNEELEFLAKVDVLLVPVGGTYTLDAKKAVEVVNQIEPRIVIPMHYKIPGLNIDIAGVDNFCHEMGVTVEKLSKLKIAKKDLPVEETKVIVLER